MLVRFRQDVVALHPEAVHLMAGTNDIAGNGGPTTLTAIKANFESMVELAEHNGIAVVLASVPPAADFGWRPGAASSTDNRGVERLVGELRRRQRFAVRGLSHSIG